MITKDMHGSATVFIVLAIAILLMAMASRSVATGDDIADVKSVVEAAFQLRGQACSKDEKGNETQFKQQLASFWSDGPRDATEVAQRQKHCEIVFPTSDPVEQTAAKATARYEYNQGLISEEEYLFLVDNVELDPGWDPLATPLDSIEAQIDECADKQSAPGWLPKSFSVNSFTYEDVTIMGDDASVEVEIDHRNTYETSSGGLDSRDSTRTWSFELKREGGQWKLIREDDVGLQFAP